ncbi:hypothetical protein RBE51_19690 [Pseudomonas taiwanensis]|uniref:hypothetical protein n=1 Tax=Pseudomonas taiwanensis TaxID=470150 RepID=UPI0028DDD1C8|nr:hypothetical protein [Pseudomonas taiwanensis]MDT8925015.1 hypothetical protein [Pseudomonas taiwanensis]
MDTTAGNSTIKKVLTSKGAAMLQTFDLIFYLFLPVISFAVYAKAMHVWWRGSRNQVKGYLPKAWFYILTSLALMASPLVEVSYVFEQVALFQRTFLAYCVLGGAISLRGLAFVHQHKKTAVRLIASKGAY